MKSPHLFRSTDHRVGKCTVRNGRFDLPLARKYATESPELALLPFRVLLQLRGPAINLVGALRSPFDGAWSLEPKPLVWSPMAARLTERERAGAEQSVLRFLADPAAADFLSEEAHALGHAAPIGLEAWRSHLPGA